MKVIGIDPGYDRLGLSILEHDLGGSKLLFSTCLVTNSKQDFTTRLKLLGQEVEKIIRDWQPNIMAIENLFITKNQKTASRVSEVRGALIYIAANHNLGVYEYSPSEIKLTVSGFGQANKQQMTKMVRLLAKMPNEDKKLDDEYDAIAVGLTYLARQQTSKKI